jgi:tetratricopeptide (TPR) repeat protein
MGLVFSLAEAVNIGWGVVAGEGASSLRDKLDDRAFRRDVVSRLAASNPDVGSGPAKRVMASDGFTKWLGQRGAKPLEDLLSDSELGALGVGDEATSEEVGNAIGQALAAIAFDRAAWIQKQLLGGQRDIDETTLGTFNFVQDIYELLTSNRDAVSDPFPVRWNTRPVTGHFTGRTGDLESLEAMLDTTSTTVVSQLVGGLGGVGKTQLVAKFAAEHRDRFDLIAWFDASAEMSSQLGGLATQIGLDGPTEDLPDLMKRWLATTDRSCLVVLDNVESPAALDGFAPAESVKIIGTTRLNTLGGYGVQLKLGLFTRNESVEYLQSRTNMTGPDAGRVAEALGDLPLALAHAGSYCDITGTSADDYLAHLDECSLSEMYAKNLDEFYQRVVHETWNASIFRVSPLAQQVMDVMAWLHPEHIPIEALSGLVDIDETAGGRLRATKSIREAAGQLVEWSLVERSSEGQLRVHRLLQRVVRDTAGGPSGRKRAVRFVVDAAEFDARQLPSWQQATMLAPHVVALLKNSRPSNGQEHFPEELFTAGDSCLAALENAGQTKAAISLGEELAQFSERMRGAAHPTTFGAWGNLALSYWAAGRFAEAIEIEERVANESQGLLGAQHPDTLTAWGNLASSYLAAGRFAEAIEIEERVANESQDLLGAEHCDTHRAWGNLASSYSAAGRLAEAIEIEERVANKRQGLLGAEHPDTLTAWGNLASTYELAGRVEEAIDIEERVANESQDLLGAEHPATLRAWGNLASTYRLAGRAEEAIEIEERVADKRQGLLGAEHPDTLVTWGNLALSYLSVGRLDDAATIQERVASESQNRLGAEHPATLNAWGNLAGGYQKAGRLDEATTIQERVANESQNRLGAEHPATLRAWANLAWSYRLSGRIQEAASIDERIGRQPGH